MKGILGILIVMSVSACGSDAQKGGPSGFVRVEILGPASLEPGQTASYSVVETRGDGSSRVLSAATWTSSDTTVVQVASSGMATAQSRAGETVIQVRTTTQGTASKEVLVLPKGTFRVVGVISEADQPASRVPAARLEVRTEPALSAPVVATATTDLNGRYRLYGVPPDAYVRVLKAGYLDTTEHRQFTAHANMDLLLRWGADPPVLAGEYAMTVQVVQCRFGRPLPPDLQVRRYRATVEQTGTALTVTARDARFLAHADGESNRFTGVVTPTGANFHIQGFYDFYYYRTYPPVPALAEVLPDGTLLVMNGRTSATGTSGTLSGVLSGLMVHYEGTLPGSVRWLEGCSEPRLTLTRQ